MGIDWSTRGKDAVEESRSSVTSAESSAIRRCGSSRRRSRPGTCRLRFRGHITASVRPARRWRRQHFGARGTGLEIIDSIICVAVM